jgi:hypothetical protein
LGGGLKLNFGRVFEDPAVEYPFGFRIVNNSTDGLEFIWAHNRDEEKLAFERFVDWVFAG